MFKLKYLWNCALCIIFTISFSAFVDANAAISSNKYALYGAWPSNNNTSANLGVALTDNILNVNNVSQLQPLFTTFTFGPGTAVQSTPVIADNNVYYATGGGQVYSYTESGQLNCASPILMASDGVTHESFDESPVLTKQYIFIAGQQMHKLNRSTCQEAVPPQVYNPIFAQNMPASHIEPSQLMVADNLVIYGIGFTDETSGNGALFPYAHGEIIAFKQDNLAIAWRIDLSKDPFTGASYGAGSGTFGQGGVDEKRHLFFMATGNQYEAPVSPYSNSLLAIDYRTGKIVWSYQYVANDIWGGGGSLLVYDGKSDLDVQGHPQIFSLQIIPGVALSTIDLVGARGKDGTYRIFTRDQIPHHVVPIAQIQLDPATASAGAIQVDPVIKDGILYIASTSWIDPSNPTVDSSLDFLIAASGGNQFAPLFQSTTKVRAIDLRKLIAYGTFQLLKGNKQAICVGSLNLARCVGQLPANIIKWTTPLFPVSPTNSSGLAYDNGVLFVPALQGQIFMLNTATGAQIGQPLVPAPLPPGFGLPAAPIGGSVSIDNGKVFVPFGLDFGGFDFFVGGITAYALPNTL